MDVSNGGSEAFLNALYCHQNFQINFPCGKLIFSFLDGGCNIKNQTINHIRDTFIKMLIDPSISLCYLKNELL